ncbi:hypothetical protein HDU91_002604, partial [Kappamyces sp. JEL0680]
DAKRYACYAAVTGDNPSANLSNQNLLLQIDPKQYFHEILPTMSPGPSRIPGKRRKYKLAYLVLIQERHGFSQLKLLLDLLDDSRAIFLVHVDKNDSELYRTIKEHVDLRTKTDPDKIGNVFLTENRYANTPKHISQVFIQLSGFWELFDMADWDYIINLSNYDWPLRHNTDIHAVLEKNPGNSYIDFLPDTSTPRASHRLDTLHKRIRPHLANKQGKLAFHPPELGISYWPFQYFQMYLQSQWMILSRDAVDFFRHDRDAYNLLAFYEHTQSPQESFFATGTGNGSNGSPGQLSAAKHPSVPGQQEILARLCHERQPLDWLGRPG